MGNTKLDKGAQLGNGICWRWPREVSGVPGWYGSAETGWQIDDGVIS